ncbi:hypothetical protein QBC32DRAFT_157616 [Pseudoneurospora amorphoporcata]|uniref:Uncharacterized protein n=1 Tax=Pseudoneurospora amorphoporcata TaxID=241081 RepID=A0AAN6NV98_9PEZI|nr:hypothetical protein QBC32DRAFT_157616 [Pseudoneurospora amorphoporcata]
MPTHARRQSHSSIDRVFDLLADLEETQISLLLDDFNHTTPSNVPVSKAIDLFETDPKRKAKRSSTIRSSSPVRNLQTELERRHSRRVAAKIAPQHLTTQRPQAKPTTPYITTPNDPSRSLSFSSSASEYSDRPVTPTDVSSTPSFRARSYKRISRPTLLSPTATAELHELLMAYLYETPSSSNLTSATTSSAPSPTTHGPASRFSPFSSSSFMSSANQTRAMEPEPFFDLFEPSPARAPVSAFGSFGGRTRAEPAAAVNISGIFEVLASH